VGIVRDAAQIGLGVFNQAINEMGARKVHRFTLKNLDTQEELEGQYGPVDPKENPGNSNYAEHSSLNRDKPIIMYTHGNAASFSFGVFFFATHETDDTPFKKITVLKKWAKRDDFLSRPPLVGFWVGSEGDLNFGPAVISAIGEISYYDPPKHGGGIRGVSATVNLREYTDWQIESEPPPETRYHHARQGDYLELIAWQEYRNPMLGDVVRKRNPEIVALQVGDVVPLPSAEAIRSEKIRPASTTFLNTQGSKSSAQKNLRAESFSRYDRSYVSGTIPSGL
jgi:hypothetical protein